MIKKFRKKPVVIEAIQFNGTDKSFKDINTFTDYSIENPSEDNLYISTLEGDMSIRKGDWIIKGVKGEFYPCKPDIFKETYEEVILD